MIDYIASKALGGGDMIQSLSISLHRLFSAIHPSSIRFRLFLVFLLFLTMMTILGLFSIGRLGDVNGVSNDIRSRWLQTTRILGDLNNFISDYRTAEGAQLLSTTPAEFAQNDKEIKVLEQQIAESRLSYEKIPHDLAENELYAKFVDKWNIYLSYSHKVLQLSKLGKKTEAIEKYKTISRDAFDTTSDTLTKLTNRNVEKANIASNRAAATYRQARFLIIAAILFAAIVLIVSVIYVIRTISNPLLALAERMRRLAEKEVNQEITGTTRRDEIGEMARAVVVFRDNAIALTHSKLALADQAVALEEALDHERRITQIQRNFVAMTSHEFRTPLTIIDSHAQRLIKMKDRLLPQDIVERASKVRSAVMRMTNLMDGLLNSSRLIDTEAEMHMRSVALDLPALLHEVCQLYRDISPDLYLVENFDALPNISGDPKLLQQAFSNLISNAIKYSQAGMPIEIGGHLENDSVVIFVQDVGIGIPEGDLGRVFERYYRGKNVTATAGSGVGLYLVKMVVDLHGGSITAENRAEQGTRFTVSLPINRTRIST